MRKVPEFLENPIDNLIYLIFVEPLTLLFHKLKFTPNMITTVSKIIGYMAIQCLWDGVYKKSVIFLLISYILDFVDGYSARKYNMTSKFGELYDHYSDMIIFGGYIGILYGKYFNKYNSLEERIGWTLFFSFCVILLQIHHVFYERCGQQYSSIAMISLEPHLTLKNTEKCLRLLRWVGPGTLVSIMCGMVLNI